MKKIKFLAAISTIFLSGCAVVPTTYGVSVHPLPYHQSYQSYHPYYPTYQPYPTNYGYGYRNTQNGSIIIYPNRR